MWYRRVTEYNDIDAPDPLDLIRVQKSEPLQPSFGQSSFNMVVFGPKESEAASKKRKREEAGSDVTQFKRVRLLSKETRIKQAKPISTPFSRYATSNYSLVTQPRNLFEGHRIVRQS